MLPETNVVDLFQAICDIESVSRDEGRLADEMEAYLRRSGHLEVSRERHCIVARTTTGAAERVIVAGHLDTVPVANNLPTQLGDGILFGRGTADMKGGVAVMAWLARELREPNRDITWIFYDREEIEASENGLGLIAERHPQWLEGASLAILMEPTSARVEGGCQGTMRFTIRAKGVAAHSARSWLGHNAIHDIGDVIARVRQFEAREIRVDGLVYREGLNATLISGGTAGNVIPDEASVMINYRFAPDKQIDEALAAMRDWFAEWELEINDLSPSARPGLDKPAARDFAAVVGGAPRPKYGWTDVARFGALGIPALNYGPGDAGKAHAVDECCPLAHVESCLSSLRTWLEA